MRSATTTPETLRDCVYDAGRQEFLVTFRDGRMYRLPRGLLPEDDGSEILGVRVDRDGSAFVVRQRSGKSFEVPWDLVLYHLDPGYPYYKGRAHRRRLEEDVAVRIGRRVRVLRQDKGLTTYELARRSGIHRPNISRMESGKHIPTVDTLGRLASALGVPVATLVSDVWRFEASLRERAPRYVAKRDNRRRRRPPVA
ncbi:MAG: helix-turn-helix domain-containing protein [Acidimicrobiia bacterium]